MFTLLVIQLLSCKQSNVSLFDKQIESFALEQKAKHIYCSPNLPDNNTNIVRIFDKALVFYADSLMLNTNVLNVVFLSREQYNKLQVPEKPYYGLCFRYKKHLFIPAQKKGMVYKFLEANTLHSNDSELNKLSNQLHVGQKELVIAALQLLGIHEIGHVLQEQRGFAPLPAWQEDFIASYLTINFITQQYPEYKNLLVEFAHIVVDELMPIYKTLDEYNLRYDYDPISYSWFQSVIFLEALKTFEQYKFRWYKKYTSQPDSVTFTTIEANLNQFLQF